MYVSGYFVHLATVIVGPWLGYWMLAAAAVTNIGQFEAEMSSDAWQVGIHMYFMIFILAILYDY